MKQWDNANVDGPIPAFDFLGLDERGIAILGDIPKPQIDLNVTPEVLADYPELLPYVVNPTNVKRVFAGDDPSNRTLTVCLSFPDEATARAVMPQFWASE